MLAFICTWAYNQGISEVEAMEMLDHIRHHQEEEYYLSGRGSLYNLHQALFFSPPLPSPYALKY